MRHFSYNEQDCNGEHIVVTVSEEKLKDNYYQIMYTRGIDAATYPFENFLEDWIVVNWAWEIA